MSKEVAALALTVLVHFVGLGALIYALVADDEQRPDWRGWWPRDDDGPPSDGPTGRPPDDGLPLRDAQPSRIRLRDERRLADRHPAPARRPVHPPQRTPERAAVETD
ncbi:MAG: hypothetical protein M3P44_14105 [Actinomycetota bacterium]|nr:hypothetical protein [Actinomycetota bacterium]